jgi:exodeoxyribonuclease VII large subunit
VSQAGLFSHTYSVSQLADDIKVFLAEAFPSVWIVGEIQRLRRSQRGHVYFELVEKGAGDEIIGRLEAVLWRTAAERVRRQLASSEQELSEGAQIRCRGRVDFYPPAGRLQLSIDEVDPVFSLGQLERRRRETLAALAAADLLDRNASLDLSLVPLRIGLVTSFGSAAYHDFMATLGAAPYGFEVLLVHAAVQGASAEREVVSALRVLAEHAIDATVLIRGGGSRSDLAAFDSRHIAEAVARHPVPVITGLGHEIDSSVSDRVAHTEVKTPTGAADFLLRRLEIADAGLYEVNRRLTEVSRIRLQDGRSMLRRTRQRFVATAHRTQRDRDRLDEFGRLLSLIGRQRIQAERRGLEGMGERVSREAPRRPAEAKRRRDRVAAQLVRGARHLLAQAGAEVEARSRLCIQFDPARVLERGFSVTRTEDGTIVRRASEVTSGQRIVTRLVEGSLTSRVEDGLESTDR